MLGKLIKHEFRATGRIMLPLFLILLACSIGANAASRGMLETDVWVLDLLGGLLIVAFSFAIVGVCMMSMMMMVQRFYKNLLQDEGYVMLTLPVSVHQHIWSKLIVSAVWFILTVIVVCIAGCIAAFDIDFFKDSLESLGDLFWSLTHVRAYYAFNGTLFLLEIGMLIFLSLAAMCLQFYAALSIGHSLPTHKMAWSVGAFFALWFAVQFCGISVINVLDRLDIFWMFHIHVDQMAAVHLGILLVIFGVVIYGAIFYGITVYYLKRRLNLE